MRVGLRTLEIYRDRNGNEPFTLWLESIRDLKTRYRIVARLDRLELGNFGDHRSLGGGLFELRLHFGPVYRVYISEVDDRIVLLLCGGEKKSQARDIRKARTYWKDYLEVRK